MLRALLALLAATVLALPPAARAGHAYVSNEDDHTVSVIDTAKNAVVKTIPVGKTPWGVHIFE